VLAGLPVLANPWVWLGAAIFVLVLLVLIFFALGQIIGVAVVALGIMLAFKADWRVGLVFIIIGAFLFFNPLDWDSLSAVPLSMLDWR
jgi:hypothetical protein